MTPIIGTKGIFTFAPPYDTVLSSIQQFTVVAVRGLTELQSSGEDPLVNVYQNVYADNAAAEIDFKNDLANGTPVIVLQSDGGDYIYVPASKILSDAKIDGIRYVEKAIIVNLGHLPENIDTAVVETIISDTVYNTIGVTPAVSVMDTSAVMYVSATKHATMETARIHVNMVDKSYLTQYTELLTLYNSQQTLINDLQAIYLTNNPPV